MKMNEKRWKLWLVMLLLIIATSKTQVMAGKVVSPTKVKLSSSAFTLKGIGSTKKLTAGITPSKATSKKITWTSSNKKVATVSNGTVKAVGQGTATITAKTTNGKKASAKVTVDGYAVIKEGTYTISTKLSKNMMLDVKGNNTSNGTNIEIYKKNGTVAQIFTIESVGDGWYTISNTYPKKCVDVKGASRKSGANVQLYEYNKTDAQKWRFYPAGNGYYTIKNKIGGCYLNVDGSKTKNGTNVSVRTASKANAQKWKLTKTKSPYVNMVSGLYSFSSKVGSNRVLDVSGNGTADGTNIRIYQSNGSMAQKFYVEHTGNGWYRIKHSFSGKCVDVQGASKTSGANVHLYTDNGTAAQRWRIYQNGNAFVIQNKLGYYLDVQGASNKNGTNVQVYKSNNTNAQKWNINKTTAILLNSGNFTLKGKGKTKKLSVIFLPDESYAANRKITWKSSKPRVATVTNGTVKAVGAGSTTITATAYNGRQASVVVTVGTWSKTNNILSLYSSAKQGYVKMSEYPIGTMYAKTMAVTNESRYANVDGRRVDMLAWQCFGYARYIQQKLYGCHDGNAASKFRNVSGSVASGQLTADKIKSVVNQAGVGAHIRTSGRQHSMIIIGITSNGFTVTDANSDGRNTIQTRTYTWQSYVKSGYGKRGLSYVKKYIG